VAIVKIIAIVAGWAVEFSLRIIAYVVGGFGRPPRLNVRSGPFLDVTPRMT
jgi:hypothetical protein